MGNERKTKFHYFRGKYIGKRD